MAVVQYTFYTQTVNRTTQTKQYIEQHKNVGNGFGRASSSRVLALHLPNNRGKSTEKRQSGWTKCAGWHDGDIFF